MKSIVDIVLVNWNSGEQLREALASISAHNEDLVGKVVVVDNDSTDGSSENLYLDSEISLTCLRNDANLGFGAACNQGARLCEGEYILFLNPDTKLFKGSLSVPLSFMENPENSGVGISGIQLVDSDGLISRTCARFPAVHLFFAQALGLNKIPRFRSCSQNMGEWDHARDRMVDQVIGAFFLIRRSLFQHLEGFDERFFVYFEEVDLSYRAKQIGWTSFYLTGAQAFHAGGGTSRQVKAKRLFYSLRSRLLYGFKHFSIASAWILVGITLLLEPLSRAVFSVSRGGLNDLSRTLEGYMMMWREFPMLLKKSARK